MSRRTALRWLGWSALTLSEFVPTSCAKTARRPNVALIVADDLGVGDLGCYGAQEILTPHLDRLASRGGRFDQFYVDAPACTPSRAGLMTGRSHLRSLLPDRGLNGAEHTIAEMLAGAGYETALFGKWHLGVEPEMQPNAQGYGEFLGHLVGAIDNYSYEFQWGEGPAYPAVMHNDQPWSGSGSYWPDVVTQRAQAFMAAHRERPFFLTVCFNLPHYPLQPGPESIPGDNASARQRYGAMVASLDHRVGELMSTLHQLNLENDTIVLFLSDHGHSAELRSGGGGSSGGLRGHKFTLWEGGIRSPLLISWPGAIPSQQIVNVPTSALDILPTIADLTKIPPAPALDGQSLVALLRDRGDFAARALHWGYKGEWAVRKGDWKLIVGETPFLIDLSRDPFEQVNRASREPKRVEQLQQLHDSWLKRLGRDPVAGQTIGN
ncbi:MAG: sulfatase-like hydrolase/transferase [Candidatus Latescibacterota bacterium]|nr:sulfatase-like hydrolase/transferase [Candidatus Latescibacterota bacterium]